MVQIFPTLTTTTTRTRRLHASFTRQANLDYAERWGHDYVQLFYDDRKGSSSSIINQTSLLVDALTTHAKEYHQLLFFPHEGVMMNDFTIDIAKKDHNHGDTKKSAVVVASHCQETTTTKIRQGQEPLLLFWKDRITLWNLRADLSTLLSLATTQEHHPTLDHHHNNINANPAVSCFPNDHGDADVTFCDSHRVEHHPAQWEWHNYSSSSSSIATTTRQQTTTTATTRKQLLIAQYSGAGPAYSKMLDVTSRISKAYCRRWHCDVVTLKGMAWKVPVYDDICSPPVHRASFGKIALLQTALELGRQYDQLLLMDADGILFDWDQDITKLLLLDDDNDDDNHNRYLLTGHKVHSKDLNETWCVNNGVTLWNLNHNLTRFVADDWSRRSSQKIILAFQKWNDMDVRTRVKRGLVLQPRRVGDQETMHDSLRENRLSWAVYGSTQEFRYANGSVVKHLLRSDNTQWNIRNDTDTRYQQLVDLSNELCRTYHPACEGI
jgi:hypothetical protein